MAKDMTDNQRIVFLIEKYEKLKALGDQDSDEDVFVDQIEEKKNNNKMGSFL